jgi:hypothetical protein
MKKGNEAFELFNILREDPEKVKKAINNIMIENTVEEIEQVAQNIGGKMKNLNDVIEMITHKAKNAVKEAAFIVGPQVYDNTKETISRSPVIKNADDITVEEDNDDDMDSYIHIDSVL